MHVVDFLLAIIEPFSLALTVATLANLSKSAFSERVGYFERIFWVDVDVAFEAFSTLSRHFAMLSATSTYR